MCDAPHGPGRRARRLRWRWGATARLLVGLWALAGGLPDSAAAAAEVYRARHRPAEELLPLAEAALAGEGSVAVDPASNALVLVAPPAALARTLELLRAQDVAPATLVVSYESLRASELEGQGLRVAWSVGGGTFRVGNVIFPGGRTGVLVSPEARRGESEAETKGTLRILSGQTGQILTGAALPVSVRHGWDTATTYVSADSGIEVRPRLLGDGRVHLELRPFEARLEGGAIEHAGAATTLAVAPGETVALGGIGSSVEASRRDAFTGLARERARDERVLLIRVEVVGPAGER